MTSLDALAERLARVEAVQAIGQLPVRYAMAVDSRDIDTWLSLFVTDVQVGRDRFGHEALRAYIEPALRNFRRSIHQICGHRIEIIDDEHATGAVYCRAEHEVEGRWIIMAICYLDEYRNDDGQWLFSRRREKHWYAADMNEHPQAVGFNSWSVVGPPALPELFSTWSQFWEEIERQA